MRLSAIHWSSLGPILLLLPFTDGALLPFESTQLTADQIDIFPDVDFGDPNSARRQVLTSPECRAFPGSDDWPTEAEWRALNNTLGGALLRPIPPAAVCYRGVYFNQTRCVDLVNNAPRTHFYVEDPLTVLTQWPQGGTCMPSLNATGLCEHGGFPEYVVNATTVRHVQAAVNFARNKNLRLIIKNTGHDFGGRSVGAGSLSVWVHHMKTFSFLRDYTQGAYTGPAVHYGAGLEAWEMYNHMVTNNVTVVAAGGRTVGAIGGWFAHGGHGNLASYYGLGCDQALELHVVTADGRFVVATPDRNTDLFYALRGGGPSTYGIVTSVVMKAYPPITNVRAALMFQVNNGPGSNTTVSVRDVETFWRGISTYFRFVTNIVDAGGVDWNYLYSYGNDSYMFQTFMTLPDKTGDEATLILQPLYETLNDIGIPAVLPRLSPSPYANRAANAPAEPLANTRYRSRLFPRANWEDDDLFAKTMAAIRASSEAGYTFHGLAMGPSKDVAGWPGADSAVNPAWRNAIMHSILIGTQPADLTPQEAREEEAKIQRYMKVWRQVSPGAGAYMNEGDPGEPEWQQSFFGELYPRLLGIKRRRDPWGVFWATTTVGSEDWEVRTRDGYPRSQNGRLCKVPRDLDLELLR